MDDVIPVKVLGRPLFDNLPPQPPKPLQERLPLVSEKEILPERTRGQEGLFHGVGGQPAYSHGQPFARGKPGNLLAGKHDRPPFDRLQPDELEGEGSLAVADDSSQADDLSRAEREGKPVQVGFLVPRPRGDFIQFEDGSG